MSVFGDVAKPFSLQANNSSNVISEGERQFVNQLLSEKHDRTFFFVVLSFVDQRLRLRCRTP